MANDNITVDLSAGITHVTIAFPTGIFDMTPAQNGEVVTDQSQIPFLNDYNGVDTAPHV